MRHRRAVLLPADRGLQARMLFAMLLPPAVTAGGIALVVALAPGRLMIGLMIITGIGVYRHLQRDEPPGRRCITVHERPELHAMVERLCVIADLAKPDIVVVEDEPHPNSWIEAPAGGRPARLHLTGALLQLLPPDELEAVIAHELSHVAHHDARVIAVVGGTGDALLKGADGSWFFAWMAIAVAWAIGSLSRLGTLSLARHRELVADAGAAALTGRPAALACALRRISGELALVPHRDLRAAVGRDVLHLVPVESELEKGPLLRTHPPLERRIARLERLEQALHAARPFGEG